MGILSTRMYRGEGNPPPRFVGPGGGYLIEIDLWGAIAKILPWSGCSQGCPEMGWYPLRHSREGGVRLKRAILASAGHFPHRGGRDSAYAKRRQGPGFPSARE